MPNVDDHGLEVLKKAARNIDPVPKKDYALQVILVKDESAGGGTYAPEIQNVDLPTMNTEVEIDLTADHKGFILRSRKVARLRLAFVANGTNDKWVTIPLGGYYVENKKILGNKIFVQSNKDNTTLEVVIYK